MILTDKTLSITVPVQHFRPDNVITEEEVCFKVSRDGSQFKAIPMLSKEERRITGLPEKMEFVYVNYCIASANNMEEETLNAIKQIILEMEVQDLL